ncbi:glycosyltransferase family 2 protein [Joostella sp.]|uniref:glycosyltransferase family 2 protein n=1 Tax=Joostella sp. TaxID=2231138 RepID=UPI003A92AD10
MTDIAIGITTRNRPEAFLTTLDRLIRFKPNNAEIFVVDDASHSINLMQYAEWVNHFFIERAGIPKAKNKSLELCYNTGSKHIFLFDDDIYPIKEGWELPYIKSGIHHLSYNFDKAYQGTPKRQSKEINGFKISQIPNGCMLYFTRECIDKVGGFNEGFGLGLYEHTDFTRRIHNAGLTPYKNMDVIGSEKLFYSMDEHGEIERNFSINERVRYLNEGRYLFNQLAASEEYVEFREKDLI